MLKSPFARLAGRWVACGVLAGALALPATAAPEAPRLISPELFKALEQHGESDVTVKSLALEQYPEAIYGYADALRDVYEGKTVDQHFEERYPATYLAYLEALEADRVTDPADFVAFTMSRGDADYDAWQSEGAIQDLTFESFVGRNFPDVVVAADQGSITPADRGLTMRDYVATLGDEAILHELDDLLGSFGTKKTNCHCWTVATFPHQPDPWQAEANEVYRNEWGWAPKKKQELDFFKSGRGAGKNFDFRRKSRHNTYEVSRTRTNYDSQMRVRMHCTQTGQEGGANCEGSSCVGELAMRTAYSSRVYEKVDVGGIWSKNSRMRTGDAAALYFDPPGPAPQQTLFEKGVAVAGNVQTGWNAEAGLTLLQTVAQVVVTVAGDGSSAAGLLEGNLLDDTYNAIIGLIEREGSEGSKAVDMQIAYDTAGTAPFILLPNTTLVFDLDTASDFYSRGYGGTSESWGNIDSSHYMVAVARNYQCSEDASPPSPQSFWLWSGTDNAPQSTTTLQNLVRNWITVELGTVPSGTGNQLGQYP